MLRALATWIPLSVLLLACNGTRTGNPAQPDGSDGPEGAQLIASPLRRDAPNVQVEQLMQLGSDNQTFAFDLYGQAAAADDGNLFMSPYSISAALAMSYAGANGDTERAIAQAMNFVLPEPDLHTTFNATAYALASRAHWQDANADEPGEVARKGAELSIVNASFAQRDFAFHAEFLDTLKLNYDAGVYTLDFAADPEAARGAINDWVEEQTEDRIVDLLPEGSIDDDVAMALVNAIYFKALWAKEFDPAMTEDGTFHAPGGDVSVPLMHAESLRSRYVDGDGFAAIELPYLPPQLRMLIVLPDADRWGEIEAGLSAAWLASARAQLATHVTDITLPRFSFSASFALSPALSALGMEAAFSDLADFSGMADEPLKIDEVYHQAFVAVDEYGTEAAAATAVDFTPLSAPPPAEIVLDRPFLFMIYDEPTGQLLFLGRLLDPS